MNKHADEMRSVIVEREFAFPLEKLWHALTQPHLIEEWLMKNDFKPDVGHRFNLRGDWGGVLDCEVLEIEPNKTLSYTWNHHLEPRACRSRLQSRERGDVYADRDRHRHASARGAIRFPQGSAEGLWRCEVRLAEVPREPGAGRGAERLIAGQFVIFISPTA